MEDHVVVDVEIAHAIGETIEVNGTPKTLTWDDTDLLGISCAVVYEHISDRFRVYGPNDTNRLRERLSSADRISGYNIWKFDFPVIWQLPGRERVMSLREKTNDILVRIWRDGLGLNPDTFSSAHKGWSLDVVARATLGTGKSGYGGDAPKWYQQDQWAKLVDYCIDDVRIERDLAAFVDKYHFVCGNGRILHLPG